MKLGDLKEKLFSYPCHALRIKLPTGQMVEPHFHITEVGKVIKQFVDCGGTNREAKSCVFQVWIANDTDHAMTTDKLKKIIEAGSIFLTDDLNVVFEYQQGTVSLYQLVRSDYTGTVLNLILGNQETACLAPDKCGLKDLRLMDGGGCCGTGCC